MKKILLSLVLLAFFSTLSPTTQADEKPIYSAVLKVRTYTYNTTNNTYSLSSIGSAVAIGSGLLLTNAHVVFNSDTSTPDGYYEVCRTINFRKKSVCFTTAKLRAYDEKNDLALLEFRSPADLPSAPLFQKDKINIGESIFVYGYPAIGGENISRVQGNIAGYEDPYYKIDGAIDHGNSGGGAFNFSGQLLGIPTRVKSDNAVLGYMIPIGTIRDFIAGKSGGYTPVDLPVSLAFQRYIKDVQAAERSTDVINDLNIKTTSLKKSGLTTLGKLEGGGVFLYGMKLSNLSESTVYLYCNRLGGELSLADIRARTSEDILKKYTIEETKMGKDNRYFVRSLRSLIATDGQDLIYVYDTVNTCAATIKNINLKKDKKIVDEALKFLTSGVTLKSRYLQSAGFDTQLFHIDTLPKGIVVDEYVADAGGTSLEIGYFSPKSNTGETLEEMTQKKRDTVDSYFLGSSSYYDDAPSDVNLKPTDYSYETLKKLYEKKYSEKEYYQNTKFTIEETKNKKKYIIGTTEYDSFGSENSTKTIMLIFSYPYKIVTGDMTEYRELNLSIMYKGGNDPAIAALKEFFARFEPIGSAPF